MCYFVCIVIFYYLPINYMYQLNPLWLDVGASKHLPTKQTAFKKYFIQLIQHCL